MSVANNEEVFHPRIAPRLDELNIGVPIKKRPLSLSDKSVVSGIPLSMNPITTLEMSNSPAGPGCGKESFLNMSKSDKIMANKESSRTVTPIDESQHQKFLALDLQLASRQSGKSIHSSDVKEEKAEHGVLNFSSGQQTKSVHEINASSNSSIGNLHNLDLNVPFHLSDSVEVLPTMHEKGTGMYLGTNQHQMAQVPLSTINSGLSQNIDSTLNLSNSYGLSHNCGSGDVILDLQLKPPSRPDLGVNWKGLAPAPELSLSLSGKFMTEPKHFSAPNALFNPELAGSSKKTSEEAATPGSDKSPAENIVKLVPCNASLQNTTSSFVSSSDNVVSNKLVKKEPEESSQQNILNRAPLLSAESSDVVVPTETLLVPEVHKSVKCEETRSAKIGPVEVTGSVNSGPLIAEKSLHLKANVSIPGPDVGLGESISRQCISTSEPSCSNVDYIPPARPNHSHDLIRKALASSSNPIAKSLVLNTRDHFATDGMSQGSAEMDCSEDDGIIISRRPTIDKPDAEKSDNVPTSKDGVNINNLCTRQQKEHHSDTPLDCSSLSSKFSMEGIDDGKSVKTKVSIVSHVGEQQGHQNEVFANEESEEKQLLKSDKKSLVDSTDNITHDVIIATGSSMTDLQRPSSLQISTFPKVECQSLDTSDRLEKMRSLEIKSESSPLGKKAPSCSKDHAKDTAVKIERLTRSEEIAKQSDLRPTDSILSEEFESNRTSSNQTNSECGKAKSASEKSDSDKTKPDSLRPSSVQNERHGQVIGNAYVNRNERWERFMESERAENKGENHRGRYVPDMINQRKTDHHYNGRDDGSQGHPRNFRGPRMRNEYENPFADEPINGRRHKFENDIGHLHRMPHKLRSGCLMREMKIDGFYGREIPGPRHVEDLPVDTVEDRYFIPHSHRNHAQGDHGFVYKERSHSPMQRRDVPMHFRRARSPEAMHRSPSLPRTERPYLPHRRHTRCHGSPLDYDERGMQRNTRPQRGMIGSHHAPEEHTLETPFHSAHLAKFHAEEELVERRRHGERRAYLRSLEVEDSVGDEEDMLDSEMEFAEARRHRIMMGQDKARGEQQENDYRHHRGPQRWRDRDASDSRPPKRWRY